MPLLTTGAGAFPTIAGGGGAPNLSSQDATQILDTTARGRVTTDGTNGTLYWVATTSATAPSAAQVKAGQDNSSAAAAFAGSVAVSGSGQILVPASGLTANTAYTMHFMHENGSAQQSSVVSSSAFTTYKASITDHPTAIDDASWAPTATTVSANATTGPDGQSTVDNLIETVANSSHYVFHAGSVTNTTAYRAVAYFKKGPGVTAPNIVQLSFGTGAFGAGIYANFDINGITVGTKTTTASTIDDLGGGWVRCTATASATASNSGNSVCTIGFTNNNDGLGKIPAYVGVITSDLSIAGAMTHAL